MLAPGTLLQNRYLVERQIGEGGMGAVYVATDQRFGSTVAIKETFFDDPALRRAFEREARLLNRLRHPALPRVSDHFSEGDGQFLVMEYIPGEDLSDMLKRRAVPFPARDVLAWADQLLDALDYLHTQEPAVIHRDIKPQNLKLLPRNQIVLLDFGLAKGTPLQTRVTATGSVFGYSFNYAPIEQMQGAGTDPRSDLYSLGATLYHLLAGTTPPDALARATAVLGGEPDPLRPAHELNRRVPPEVSAPLTRAMALSAAARYASAEEMRAALREAARHVGEVDEEAAASPGVSAASEQATRLLVADGAGATRTPRAGETGVAGAPEAATVLDAGESRLPESSGGRATKVEGAAATAVSAEGIQAGDSVVTRVSPARASDAKAGGSSRRALAYGAGAVALALVGVAVYSFALRGADAPTAQPEPVPQVFTTPAPATPTPEQAAAPEPTPGAPTARRPAASTDRSAKRRAAEPREPAEADAPDDPGPDAAFAERDWPNRPMTDAELREILRHASRARRHAIMERQRVLREQRRRPHAPPPPPTQPRP